MADPRCLPSHLVRSRGLEPPTGGPLPANETIEICDLIDENGNTAFKAGRTSAAEFTRFLESAGQRRSFPASRNFGGQKLLAFGNGPVFSFPPECRTDRPLTYRCPRNDGLIERHFFEEDKRLATWRYLMEVRKPDGRLIRKREQSVSMTGVTNSELASLTTWYLGGMEFIAADDNWGHRFVENPGEATPLKARHINVRYLNPYRPSTTYNYKNGSFFSLDSFTYDAASQRQGFYRSIDRLVADHDISFRPKEDTVVVDGRPIEFWTRKDGEALHEAGRWDLFFGVATLAPFIHLLHIESYFFFWGTHDDLVSLAREHGIETCLPKKNRYGLHCDDERAIFVVSDSPGYERDQIRGHDRRIRHELGHALQLATSDPFSTELYERYVRNAFLEAGVPEGADLNFLLEVALGDTDTVDLPPKMQQELDWLWETYRLGRYFPTPYSLSGNEELFSDVVSKWHPWHEYEADRQPLHGLFYALDALLAGGADAFRAELEAQYPHLTDCH